MDRTINTYIIRYLFFDRTKDSAWVHSMLDQSIPEAVSFANSYGQNIDAVAHMVNYFCLDIIIINILKTDRPKTEFWNSANVEAARDLAKKHNLTIMHLTHQSHHGKVMILVNIFY